MRTVDECLVCGGRDFAVVFSSNYGEGVGEAHRFFLTQRERAVRGDIRRCVACGFRFTSPQFSAEEYDQIYSNVPAPPPSEEADAARVRFKALAGRLKPYVSDNARLLDFGCGGGGFLEFAGGRDVSGFEVSTDAPSWDGRIFRGRISDARQQRPEFRDQSFDVIVAWDVFEHLPELSRDVATLRNLLKPGGVLSFSIPNVGSLAAKVQGKNWNSYLLEHLWYFRPKTIDAYLSQHGFKRLALEAIPYPASARLLVRRLNQTFPMRLPEKALSEKWILPFPIGLMFGVYKRT